MDFRGTRRNKYILPRKQTLKKILCQWSDMALLQLQLQNGFRQSGCDSAPSPGPESGFARPRLFRIRISCCCLFDCHDPRQPTHNHREWSRCGHLDITIFWLWYLRILDNSIQRYPNATHAMDFTEFGLLKQNIFFGFDTYQILDNSWQNNSNDTPPQPVP